MTKKTTKKEKDELGMSPAVHRKKLENDIEEVHDRIDILIEDFGEEIAEMKKKLDKACSRLGLPLS